MPDLNNPSVLEQYIKDRFEDAASAWKAEMEETVSSSVSDAVDAKYASSFGNTLKRIKWMAAGAALVIAALAIERISSDQLTRGLFNRVIGFEQSFSEAQAANFKPKFKRELDAQFPVYFENQFRDHLQKKPYLLTAYNHSEEIVFSTCADNTLDIPFHFDRETHKASLFVEFRPFQKSIERIRVTGRVNNISVGEITKIDDLDRIMLPDSDVTEQIRSSGSLNTYIQNLSLRVSPLVPGESAGVTPQSLSLSSLETVSDPIDRAKDPACKDMGGTLRVLLKILGDPRHNG